MSDFMQGPLSRSARSERMTTSCGECRRRKQKCNQGQPCSNCARRFPQPVCEYKSSSRRSSAATVPQRPAFAVALSSSILPRSHGYGGETFRQASAPQHSPLFAPWNERRNSSEEAGEIVSDWPGYQPFAQTRLASSTDQYAWSTDQQSLSMSVIACEEGCTLHSEEVHEAIAMLHAYRSTQRHWGSNDWTTDYSAWTLVPAFSPEPGGIPWPVSDPGQGVVQVPVAPMMQDAELLSIFVKFISQFTASLDGKPDASNSYIKYYIPYCVNSQLLARVAIYSAACFLTDSGHVETTVAMSHKGHAIKLLNERIQSQPSTSDEVIAGVGQLVLDEWLWGNTKDLRAHLRGLREMIRSRGGFQMLGLHGIISKLAISCDVAVALSFEVSPFLRGGPEFEFSDNTAVPFRLALNTPWISTLAPFSSCDSALRIHHAVACILDDMRFLLNAVLALPEQASAKELQKVHTTSAWIHERISSLPDEAPAPRRPSAASSPPGKDSSAMPETREDQQHPQASPGRSQPRQAPVQGQAQAPLHSPTVPPPLTASDPSSPPPDHVYQAVRLAALLYSRAIMRRQPFSLVVTPAEFLRLWATAWRVPLSTWRSLLGVLNWILLPILPSGKAAQPHDRFVKGMMNISLFQMGMENWGIASSVMEAGLSLQRWLAGEGRAAAGPAIANLAGGEGGGKSGWQVMAGSPGRDIDAGQGAEAGGARIPGQGGGKEGKR